jgi:hypothetical protein
MDKINLLAFILFLTYLSTNIYVSAETAEERCRKYNSTCSECVADKDCFWCGSTDSCQSFNFIPKGCAKANWYAGQCTLAGFWFIIVLPCVAVFLLIFFICCCWCCCCQKDKAAKEERYSLRTTRRQADREKRRSYFEERNNDREIERDGYRTKYGLYNDTPNYKRFTTEDA